MPNFTRFTQCWSRFTWIAISATAYTERCLSMRPWWHSRDDQEMISSEAVRPKETHQMRIQGMGALWCTQWLPIQLWCVLWGNNSGCSWARSSCTEYAGQSTFIFFNNNVSSVPLASSLLIQNTFCIATTPADRKDWPIQLKVVKALNRQLQRGTTIQWLFTTEFNVSPKRTRRPYQSSPLYASHLAPQLSTGKWRMEHRLLLPVQKLYKSTIPAVEWTSQNKWKRHTAAKEDHEGGGCHWSVLMFPEGPGTTYAQMTMCMYVGGTTIVCTYCWTVTLATVMER